MNCAIWRVRDSQVEEKQLGEFSWSTCIQWPSCRPEPWSRSNRDSTLGCTSQMTLRRRFLSSSRQVPNIHQWRGTMFLLLEKTNPNVVIAMSGLLGVSWFDIDSQSTEGRFGVQNSATTWWVRLLYLLTSRAAERWRASVFVCLFFFKWATNIRFSLEYYSKRKFLFVKIFFAIRKNQTNLHTPHFFGSWYPPL